MTIWFSRNMDWSRLLSRLAADRVRIKAGAALEDRDERAWTELYGRLLGLAWTFIDRPEVLEEREDAVHDVMLKLYLHDGAFFRLQSSRKPSGYAVAMLRNAAVDIVRRYARSRAAASEALKRWDASEPHSVDGILNGALAKLSERDRALLHDYYWCEKRATQIATEWGISASAVGVGLFRARRRLKGLLEAA